MMNSIKVLIIIMILNSSCFIIYPIFSGRPSDKDFNYIKKVNFSLAKCNIKTKSLYVGKILDYDTPYEVIKFNLDGTFGMERVARAFNETDSVYTWKYISNIMMNDYKKNQWYGNYICSNDTIYTEYCQIIQGSFRNYYFLSTFYVTDSNQIKRISYYSESLKKVIPRNVKYEYIGTD